MAPFTARKADKQRIIASEFEAIAVIWNIPDYPKGFEIPISSFSMTFNANLEELPTARIEAALGVNMRTRQFSEVPAALSESTEVSVYFRASGSARFNVPWPKDWHLIWHGRVSGMNISLGFGSFNITLDSVHWTKLLDYSSCAGTEFVRSSHVDAFAAAGGATVTGENIRNANEGLISLAMTAVKGEKITPPIWDKVAVPMLAAMASPSSMFPTLRQTSTLASVVQGLNTLGCGVTDAAKDLVSNGLGGNLRALSLIARTELTTEDSVRVIVNGGPSTDKLKAFPALTRANLGKTKPTGFYFNNAHETNVANLKLQIAPNPATSVQPGKDAESALLQLAGDLSQAMTHNLGTHSLLDKANYCASLYQFRFLPNARTVCVAPAIPIFPRKNTWRTLSTDECTIISSPSSFPTKLSGVVLMGDPAAMSKTDVTQQDQFVHTPYGAYFGDTNGRIEILTTPGYLGAQPVEPDAGAQANVPTIVKKTRNIWPKSINTTRVLLGCRVAQAQWSMSTFSGFQLQLASPLRFDIGPGSYIRVENFNTASPVGQNEFGNVFGYVESVTVSMDANSGSASTRFLLTHLRPDSDKLEKDLPQWHPMYSEDSTWSGHELVRMNRKGGQTP